MTSDMSDQATRLVLYSPLSPTQAEHALRRVLEPANSRGLLWHTREANRALFAGTIAQNHFQLQLVHPYQRQRYTLAITGDIAASADGSMITLDITDGGIILPPIFLRLAQVAVFAIPALMSLYFVSLWWEGTVSLGCGMFPGALFLITLWFMSALGRVGRSDPDRANAVSHLRTVFAVLPDIPRSTSSS